MPNTNSLSRRHFIQRSLAASAVAGLSPTFSARAAAGRAVRANEEIRVAIVGFNGQGGSHIESLTKLREQGEKVRIAALCDVDSEVLGRVTSGFATRGQPVQGYTDIRKLLENPEIDALSIATPNHWHALATIWAVQQGKDVYVEKPVSHNVWEGRQIVNAARKYNRIVQTGTQSRSSREGIAAAVAWVQAGNLGKVKIARGLCYKPRKSIGKVDGPQPVPPNIDYDLWCGPAPKEPLHRKRLHYDWHWVWPTGCGDLGNQGIHQMDISRWFLGVSALSPRICSLGGRLGYDDDGTTPNTQVIFHDYPDAALIFEVRGLPRDKKAQADSAWNGNGMDRYKGADIGVIVHCEGGYVLVPNYSSAIAYDRDGKEVKKFSGAVSHHGNFLKAMRTGNFADLHADILEGHLSSALCHTGNISYRLGKQAPPADIRDVIRSQPDAEDTFQRMLDHLKANEVDVMSSQLTVGPVLTMDPKAETFRGNPEANALLTRNYRAPFVVPAKV